MREEEERRKRKRSGNEERREGRRGGGKPISLDVWEPGHTQYSSGDSAGGLGKEVSPQNPTVWPRSWSSANQGEEKSWAAAQHVGKTSSQSRGNNNNNKKNNFVKCSI